MLPLPLYLLRAIDLSGSVAAAYAARALADAGAEVIRVEASAGAGIRGGGAALASLGRNQLSLGLDASGDAGREVRRRLLATADIVLVDATSAAAVDERDARAGLIVVSLPAGGGAAAGIAAAAGALAAAFHRRATGRGQTVTVAAGVPGSRRGAAALPPPAELRKRGFVERVGTAEGAVVETDGVPYRYGRTPAHVRLPAPRFGEHNHYVLRDLLGLDAAAVAALRAARVVRGGRFDDNDVL